MAAWSIVNFKDFHEALDFDPEHYHPQRFAAMKALSQNATRNLGEFFDESALFVDTEGAESFDTTHALGNFLSFEGKGGGGGQRKVAQAGDIMISRLRSYLRQVCLVPERNGFQPLLSPEFWVLRPTQPNSEWIVAFLLSEPVQTILRWSQTGSNHPRFPLRALRKLPVSQPLLAVTETVAQLVREANDFYEQSVQFYPQAEAELLERLGWDEIKSAPRELFYECDWKEMKDEGRADPEFFQPHYARLRAQIEERGGISVQKSCYFIKHGLQPEYDEDGDVGIISQRQFKSQGLDLDLLENFTNQEFTTKNPDFALRRGDVLVYSVSAGEHLGRTYLFDSPLACVAASFVNVLRTKELVPGYLALFLNSMAGTTQTNALKRGTSPFYVYPRDLAKVEIFVPKNADGKPDLAWQQRLADRVLEASSAKTRAREKLDEAKELVESAIGN